MRGDQRSLTGPASIPPPGFSNIIRNFSVTASVSLRVAADIQIHNKIEGRSGIHQKYLSRSSLYASTRISQAKDSSFGMRHPSDFINALQSDSIEIFNRSNPQWNLPSQAYRVIYDQ